MGVIYDVAPTRRYTPNESMHKSPHVIAESFIFNLCCTVSVTNIRPSDIYIDYNRLDSLTKKKQRKIWEHCAHL